MNLGISVICSTNKREMMENIIENFISQAYQPKELIIILNYEINNMDKLNKLILPYENIQMFSLGNKKSLGECLNFGVTKSKYPVIAKFDDDDYYGPCYLSDSIKPLTSKEIGIVGKACIYIYFTEKKILAIRDNYLENRFVTRVSGSTLIFKKDLFNKIKFQEISLGEDIRFCIDCIKIGYKIFSTNRHHYVYIRNRRHKHTWKMDNFYILKNCTQICKTEKYKDFVCNSVNNSK